LTTEKASERELRAPAFVLCFFVAPLLNCFFLETANFTSNRQGFENLTARTTFYKTGIVIH